MHGGEKTLEQKINIKKYKRLMPNKIEYKCNKGALDLSTTFYR